MKKYRFKSITLILLSALTLSAKGAVLEEIIVSAQKREQTLQDVPVSVSVISGDFIQSSAIGGLEELAFQMPNVTVTQTSTGDAIFVRGIGSGVNLGFEQSVGTFIDGAYFGRDAQSRSKFLDVERVEILRGPQSALFGNNTIAGALNITTKKPGQQFEGYVTGFYGPEDGDRNFEIVAGGPITDTFGARVAFQSSGLDGYITNKALNREEPDRDNLVGRIITNWNPTDQFDATFKVEYGDFHDKGVPKEMADCPPPPPYTPGTACILGLGPGAAYGFEGKIDGNSSRGNVGGSGAGTVGEKSILHTRLFQANLNYEFNEHMLTAITAYSAYNHSRAADIDSTPLAIINSVDYTDFDQLSQEIRLTSPVGEKFEYIVGVYWQTSDLRVFENLFAKGGPVFAEQASDFDQEEETFAGFASLTWNISENLRTTVGLRYTEVEKDLVRSITVLDPITRQPSPSQFSRPPLNITPHGPDKYNRSDDDFNPSINVQYDLNDNVMLYASFSTGFKSGGYDVKAVDGTLDSIAYDPEEVVAYEIGAKTTLFDSAVEINLALFRSEYDDLQISVYSGQGVVFFVDNAASSITEGLEIDLRWAVTDNLNITLAGSIMDAYYDDFPSGPCSFFDELAAVGNCPFGRDFKDEPLTFAPDWSGNLVIDHSFPLSNGLLLSSQLSVEFTDEFHTRTYLDPRTLQEEYVKANLRLALSDTDHKWEVAAIVKNLGNKQTTHFSGRQALAASSYWEFRDRMRYFLIQATYNW